MATLYCGDALGVLSTLPNESVQCCVTSPPYWGLRDYGVPGQLGLEATPEEYVEKLVAVFREVWRVLRKDGTLWLNLGDSYAGSWGAQSRPIGDLPEGEQSASEAVRIGGLSANQILAHPRGQRCTGSLKRMPNLKAKDLIGIPWRIAFALQADGWWLRSDIIWSKPNPMPESVTDRPTRSHEYVFLLAKAKRYYYDADAIRIGWAQATVDRLSQPTFDQQTGGPKDPKDGNRSHRKALVNLKGRWGVSLPDYEGESDGLSRPPMKMRDRAYHPDGPNSRTVWEIATQPYPEAHFATFPEELARRCVLAGSRSGDTVLDPFGGSGTVAQVATGNGRDSIYIDLKPEYLELARQRIGPMLCNIAT